MGLHIKRKFTMTSTTNTYQINHPKADANDTTHAKGAKVALVTGGARRIGACLVQTLHKQGFRLIVHYKTSADEANELVGALNQLRPNSAVAIGADLNDMATIEPLVSQCLEQFGRLDILINNASSFYPTPLPHATLTQWDDLMNSNLKAPLFLAQACAPSLLAHHGCIVNIVDIYARRPLQDHPIYCAAKAGLEMLTRSFARDLAPNVRVNAVAPGAILWPENDDHPLERDALLEQIPMGRLGDPEDIAQAVLFLVCNAPYITGQTIVVDGGRSVVN
jgi:pteridine reductase